MDGQRVIRHLLLPSAAPAALVGLYFTPVAALGCVTRGILALAVAFLALAAAVAAANRGIAARRRGDHDASRWWIVTTLILLVPLALLAGPLG